METLCSEHIPIVQDIVYVSTMVSVHLLGETNISQTCPRTSAPRHTPVPHLHWTSILAITNTLACLCLSICLKDTVTPAYLHATLGEPQTGQSFNQKSLHSWVWHTGSKGSTAGGLLVLSGLCTMGLGIMRVSDGQQ